jgi:glycosyltransferase involved in cell wall biosynthesis
VTWGHPALSPVFIGAYLAVLTLLWTALIVGTGGWGRRWYLHRPPLTDEEITATRDLRLTICIPARDEVVHIGRCVNAALATRWPDLEVIVIDDRSRDATAEAARLAGGDDPRLRVVTGVEPPMGWAGKPWACARAAGEARGELLCFVDADVVLDPDAIPALIRTLIEKRLSLVSAFGTWELVGFWERVVIPAVGWLIRGAVDLDQVNDPGRPEAFANGQIILVERQAYEALDGHGSVRDQILEDVRLAQQFKRRGHTVGLMVAPWAFQVRLYETLGQIIRGYAKNLYEGMGRRPIVGLGAVLFIFVGALLPFIGLVGGLYVRHAWGWGVPGDSWLLWTAAVCALQVVFRWRLERRDGRSGAMAWSHPLANVVLVAILLRSMFAVKVSWKGRGFVDGRASSR